MITFFVSSTFKDMVGEREALHREILPQINKEIRKYGEYISICDLRWGLDTGKDETEEAIAKAMEVCAEAIDNCRPYMLILLGGYYGTVPEFSTIEKCLTDHHIPHPADAVSMSVTQFEIEYGIFSEKAQAASESICCFRDLDTQSFFHMSKEDGQRIERLKRRLREKAGVFCMEYKAAWDSEHRQAAGLGDLGKQLQKTMIDIVKKQYGFHRKLNWIEQELLLAESFCTRKLSAFGGRSGELKELREMIFSGFCPAIGVWGDSGIGKSSLLSKLYERVRQEKHFRTCFIACGYGERSSIYLDILRQIDYFINTHLFHGEDDEGSWREDFKKGHLKAVDEILTEERGEKNLRGDIGQYEHIGTEKLVIFVDALDKLSSINEIRLLSLFAEQASSKIILVCSQVEAFHKGEDGMYTVRLNPLNSADIEDIFKENTSSQDRHIKSMTAAFQKKTDVSPLHIVVAIRILKMHLQDTCGKTEDKIYSDFLERIGQLPPELPKVCWQCIEEAGTYLDVRLYQEIAGLIAVTRRGIRENDLEAILSGQWKSVEFARLCMYLSEFFYCGNQGKWNFSHDLMKEGALEHMRHKNGGRSQEEILEDQWFSYLETKEKNDEIRISEGLFLCAKRNATAFALTILEEAADSEEKMDYTLAVRTLGEIIGTESGRQWFESCIQANPILIARLLKKGLYFSGAADYTRRYPSYELAKIFWEKKGLRLIDKFDRLCKKEQEILFHMCAEYVGILDDISENKDSLPYTNIVVSVIKNTQYETLSMERKEDLFRCANLVFFPNNRYLGFLTKNKEKVDALIQRETEQADQYSREIFQWYQTFIKPEYEMFLGGETLGKFVNNVGQYYNAIKDYNQAAPYRMESLEYKCRAICKNIGIEFPEWPDGMKSEAAGLRFHEQFWEAFLVRNKRQLTETIRKESEAGRNTARNQWNAMGVTYRTSAADHFALAEESPESAAENYALSKNELELCLWFQQQDFLEGLDKELLVTGVRWIGSAAGLSKLTKEIPDRTEQIVDTTCNIARRLYRNEKRECSMCLENCRKLADALEQENTLQTQIRYQIERLEKYLAIYI